MIFRDLPRFLGHLERCGALHRVPVPVDPRLEIAAVTQRAVKSKGDRALLFEEVAGTPWPVATNLFGSLPRVAQALGGDSISGLSAVLAADLAATPGATGPKRLRHLTGDPECLPQTVSAAPCREVEAPPDLLQLPALQSWPEDGGSFLTQPLVFTRDPESGEVNCGLYRMQIFDADRAGLHFAPGSDGAKHCAAWRRRREPMPVAVALGGDPALICAAAMPLPPGVDEAAFAGYLRGAPVTTTECRHSELQVPAGAEFVLEGWVFPGEERKEGPFGNHTGHYAEPEPCPVLRVATVTHRRDPLFPATVVGPPPTESAYLAKAAERLFLPLLQVDFPEIADINLPLETIFHGCALVAAHKENPAHPSRLMAALRETPMFRKARLLAVFDADVDVQDPAECWWRAVNHLDPAGLVIDGEKGIGMDATCRGDARPVIADPEIEKRVARRWRSFGFS